MKKVYKLSIIAMLLLLSLPCRAQISSIIAEATPQFSNDSGIVRYWKDSIFISCNKDHQRKYVFSLVEGSNTTILQAPIHVPDIEKVTDFQILDGYVYFCGMGSYRDQSGRNAFRSIIGRFSIDDIYAGTIVYEIMRLQYDYKLFRLAVYDITHPHIVALGYVMTNGKEKGILIECFYDYAQTDFVGYQYYYCSGSYPIFDDIVVTDNYVVIVADYGHLCLYRCPKANIAAGIMGNEYHYNTLYVRQPERAAATAMKGDTIATSCPAVNVGVNPNRWSNNIYIFDINNMQMIDAQGVEQNDKGNSRDMVYVPLQGKLVVSHYLSVPDQNLPNTELFSITPFAPAPYATDAVYDLSHSWRFCYLDVLQGRYVVSVDGSRWLVLDMLARQNTCVKSYQKNVSLLKMVAYSKVQSPYMSASYKPVTFKVPQPIDQYLINVTCQ